MSILRNMSPLKNGIGQLLTEVEAQVLVTAESTKPSRKRVCRLTGRLHMTLTVLIGQ